MVWFLSFLASHELLKALPPCFFSGLRDETVCTVYRVNSDRHSAFVRPLPQSVLVNALGCLSDFELSVQLLHHLHSANHGR